MVGYKKDDKLTPHQKFLAGCVSGAVTKFITQPLDVIKLRIQLEKPELSPPKESIFMYTRHILRHEGFSGLWRGHGMGQVHSIIALSSQFYIYEETTRLASNSQFKNKNIHAVNFVCGVIAGCGSSFLSVPLEVIRMHHIILKDPRYNTIFGGAKKIYKFGGISAFYEGFVGSCLQIGPAVGISFTIFNLIQPMILNMTQACGDTCSKLTSHEAARYVILASCGAGLVAGFISKAATYPMDIVKRRMQMNAHASRLTDSKALQNIRELIKCDSFFACMHKYFKQEGAIGLYRGFRVTLYRALLQTITSFTVYEVTCFMIRESLKKAEKKS